MWDGRLARVDAKGKRRLEGERRLKRTLFVLARRAGQATRLADTFTTAHCRTCGAHDAGGIDPACPYCAAPRRGDASTWLVTEIVEHSSREAHGLRAELLALAHEPAPGVERAASPAPGARGLLDWAVALVRADDEVEDRERRAILRLAEREGIARESVEAALDGSPGAVPTPRDDGEARAWLAALIELALADGVLKRDERRFLRDAAQGLGVQRAELGRLLKTARTALYRESRSARRSERQ